VRNLVGPENFVLAYVSTTADVCEERDVKGFYKKARAGEIKGFTGVDDPYEAPESADVVLDTVNGTPEQNARKIVEHLGERGFLE
ncbi:MAG: adenylyl-sulfate kinase, partial [Bryobacteraceae bacterium]